MHVDVAMSSHPPLLPPANLSSSTVTSNSSGHDDTLALGLGDRGDALPDALPLFDPLSLTLLVTLTDPLTDPLPLNDGDTLAVADTDTLPVSLVLLVGDADTDADPDSDVDGVDDVDGLSDTVGVSLMVADSVGVGVLLGVTDGDGDGVGLTHSPLVTEICTLSMPRASLLGSSS